MELVIVDSDILTDVSRNDRQAVDVVSKLEEANKVAISSITAAELIIGCQNKPELARVKKFLQRFQVIQINEQFSEVSIDLLNTYNLSHGLLIPDAMIAATALTLDETFITKNQRDFRFIEGLKLLGYP